MANLYKMIMLCAYYSSVLSKYILSIKASGKFVYSFPSIKTTIQYNTIYWDNYTILAAG